MLAISASSFGFGRPGPLNAPPDVMASGPDLLDPTRLLPAESLA